MSKFRLFFENLKIWYNFTENLNFLHNLLEIPVFCNILAYPGYAMFTTLTPVMATLSSKDSDDDQNIYKSRMRNINAYCKKHYQNSLPLDPIVELLTNVTTGSY